VRRAVTGEPCFQLGTLQYRDLDNWRKSYYHYLETADKRRHQASLLAVGS
jgi:hypothetical protein